MPWKGASRSLLGRRDLLAIDTSSNHCLNAKAEAGVAVKQGMWNHFFGLLVFEELVFQYLLARRSISASSILKHDCWGISRRGAGGGGGCGGTEGYLLLSPSDEKCVGD